MVTALGAVPDLPWCSRHKPQLLPSASQQYVLVLVSATHSVLFFPSAGHVSPLLLSTLLLVWYKSGRICQRRHTQDVAQEDGIQLQRRRYCK